MKFEGAGFAAGFITAAGIILAVIFAFQLDIFVDTPICAGDENGLTCARNWANAVAILAAAGTIFFLAREQAFARRSREEDVTTATESQIFNSLRVRARIRTSATNALALSHHADELQAQADKLTTGEYSAHSGAGPYVLIHLLGVCDRTLADDSWVELCEYEGSLRRLIFKARLKIAGMAELVYGYGFSATDILNGLSGGAERHFMPEFRNYLSGAQFQEVCDSIRQVHQVVVAFEEAVSTGNLRHYFSERP